MIGGRLAAAAAVLALVLAGLIEPMGWRIDGALARTRTLPAGGAEARAQRNDSRPPRRLTGPGKPTPRGPRAPASRPLLGPQTPAMEGGDEPQAGGSPQAETDPLVRNGLGSPLCAGAPGGSGLSGSSRRNCETSGFVAAAVPTGNFGIDVHIDTGLLGLSSGQLQALVQDLFVTPLWMALVWAVHALVVMLEWCFTIDLLDGDSVRGGVAGSLRAMQDAITVPWLATVLPIAAVLCAYHGLVRRRVVESLAEALLVLAMTAGGIWVTLDPTETVGAMGRWANQASLGTLAVTARGSPGAAGRTLADSMGLVFATAIEVPWCYLEFGDVDWCRNPARLDRRLRSVAMALASSELRDAHCPPGSHASAGCEDSTGADVQALERSARLLRAARTNGEIFLALPPNGPARNAINDPTSLLRAICESENATDCRGPAAAQAEFRTNRGTWPRVGGLLLITLGVLGLLLLLGFVALRLLGAAVFALLYLMLAPAAALAPALGEWGRAAFRRWAAQLIGAVVSKLLFAFLLGVLLAILAILEQFEALGWWTRWLLISAFWWGAFVHRHQVLQLAGWGRTQARAGRRPALRRVNDALDARARAHERVLAAKERFQGKPPELDRAATALAPGSPGGPGAGALASAPGSTQGRAQGALTRRLRGSRGARNGARTEGEVGIRTARGAARLDRITGQRAQASAVGNRRRAARLATRAERIEAEMRERPRERESERAGTAGVEREARYARFLDAQSRLPGADGTMPAQAQGWERSYAALAGLAGYGRRDYLGLDQVGKRVARLQIDRELALRRELAPVAHSDTGPRSRVEHAAPTVPRHGLAPSQPRPARGARSESSVMRDARDVAAGRKRQLGRDRP
jgi:hypothetical protein